MNRLRCVLLTTFLCACGGGGESTASDARDGILNGTSEAASGTYWDEGNGAHRIAIFSDGTCIQQMGVLGNGTRATFTWTKVAPDLIFIDTSVGGPCYITSLRAISGSLASGAFRAQMDETANCNVGFTRDFTLVGGHVPN